MICADVHVLLDLLGEEGLDVVQHLLVVLGGVAEQHVVAAVGHELDGQLTRDERGLRGQLLPVQYYVAVRPPRKARRASTLHFLTQ